MARPKQLALLSEFEFGSRAPSGFPVGCPTLDLAATWDANGSNLFIYRPPGQVVSRIHQLTGPGKKAPEAVAVTWKPDGQFLAVAWSDGVVRLMGLENNKAAHHIPVCDQTDAAITHIGWASCSIADNAAPGHFKGDLGREWGSIDGEKLPADLPRELTFLEVDTALPKISPLPSGSAGSDEDATVFTLRTGIEFLFQAPKPEDHDRVNVMVVGTDDGKLHLSIYDSFAIGSFQCPCPHLSQPSVMIHHASHPLVSTHALLLAPASAEADELQLVPMDLPFVASSPTNLSLLASKLTTLQKLLRYLRQTQLHMQVEWKNAKELPARFLRIVQGGLEQTQSGPKGIVPALYHTAVTGHVYPPVREWLVDSLAERGHKRWDKAVVSGLENLRSLVHENFIPALDRCSIILSRLRGLAMFHKQRDDIGFSVAQISRVMDIMACLSLVGHKILTHVMDELEHFAAFSTWIRFQIDRLASSANDDLTEKGATMDSSRVLTYIERYLTSSPLDLFFDEITKEDYSADWEHCEDGPSLLDMLDKQLVKHESGQPSMRALPHVSFLVSYATTWANRVFKDIAEAEKRSVRFGEPVKLSIGRPIGSMDIVVSHTQEGGTIYTALAPKEADGKVCLFRVAMDITNGISANRPAAACAVDLAGRKLVDVRFLNKDTLILACGEADGTPVIISVPVASGLLPYTTLDAARVADMEGISAQVFEAYRLPAEHSMKPVRMEAHDESNVRGEMPARICFLGSNRTTWRAFSIPT